MDTLYLLTDYLGHFESKQRASPKYGGMDKLMLAKEFADRGFEVVYAGFAEVDFRMQDHRGKYFLYTSSEDPGYYYKDYIEDIIYGLSLQGATVIPPFPFLRANNNKVFMEILRDLSDFSGLKNVRTRHFGTLEELVQQMDKLPARNVLKPSRGAMSKGVSLADNGQMLLKLARTLSRSRAYFSELWDFKNTFKYKGFIPGSRFRKKFIVQNFVPGLDHDWKILIYGSRYFILRRDNRPGDFRASGSGRLKFTDDIPQGMLDFAAAVYAHFNIPNLSIDVASDGQDFYLLEFQALYFGTYTLEESPFHYQPEGSGWKLETGRVLLEAIYAESVAAYIRKLQS